MRERKLVLFIIAIDGSNPLRMLYEQLITLKASLEEMGITFYLIFV